MPKARKRTPKSSRRSSVNTLPLYVLLVVLFALYLFFQHVQFLALLLGLMLFIVFVILVVFEFASSAADEGIGKSALEIAIAIGIVLVIWFAARFLLNTASPLDVVPSCSMLPHLGRGDIILLHGISSASQLHAPVINVSTQEFSRMKANISSEFLSCVAYNVSNGRVTTSQIMKPGYSIGLYNLETRSISRTDAQGDNLVQYTCGTTPIRFSNGTVMTAVSTTAISVAGTTIIGDRNNSIVVYQTAPQDLFYKLGDSYIVHRAYAVLNVEGSYYVLTKGDNNPGLDLQYGNYPANMTSLQGRVVASVPYLGYVKLIFARSFVEPAGCNSTLQG